MTLRGLLLTARELYDLYTQTYTVEGPLKFREFEDIDTVPELLAALAERGVDVDVDVLELTRDAAANRAMAR